MPPHKPRTGMTNLAMSRESSDWGTATSTPQSPDWVTEPKVELAHS
jgi:hypothetical protein